MNNPFDFDAILNGYANDGVSVAGSDLRFEFESPRIDFEFENYEQPIENIDDLTRGGETASGNEYFTIDSRCHIADCDWDSICQLSITVSCKDIHIHGCRIHSCNASGK